MIRAVARPRVRVPRSAAGARGLAGRVRYLRRVFRAYLTPTTSHLTFWHEVPTVQEGFVPDEIGPYYMPFTAKADYAGDADRAGIPMLNYHGAVGVQYNPIAIAQYGLGNFNLFLATGQPERRRRFAAAADWLVANLERNPAGVPVWNHHFDWEYRTVLRAPWYSALAQGQGISLLLRAHRATGDDRYVKAASAALESFRLPLAAGGVTCIEDGYTWFEETIVDPPTHILNGFLWASWGVHDYALACADKDARALFDAAVHTLVDHLDAFDTGFWSLYEQSGTRMHMLASPFYHRLHIVQLQVMARLTGLDLFARVADRWDGYRRSRIKRNLALGYKAVFKLVYY